MRRRNPLDVRVRRFVVYVIRRSCAREVWVARRGSKLMSTYGAVVIRRMMFVSK